MIRVAVIGVGSMGRNHARVYREMAGVDLVGVVDVVPSAAQIASRLYGTRAYTDYRELLGHAHLDAVSVAVPTHLHSRVVSDALAAGCHVLVEKPIAATLEEAEQLIAAAEKAERRLMVGHIERYNPAIIELKRRLAAGVLGRVFQIHARRLGPFPARIRDVGVVIDLATHDLDIMRYLTGSEVARVYAQTRQKVHTSQEDLLTGILHFADETVGLLEINWLTPTKIRELYVTGERGMFRADYLTQDLYFFENLEASDSQWQALGVLRGVSEGSMVRYAIQRREPLRAELEAFVAIARGESAPVVEGQDGKSALALALALIESARMQQVKLVEPVSATTRAGEMR